MNGFVRSAAAACAILAWMAPSAQATPEEDEALEQLNRRNIVFSPEEFVDVVTLGDTDNVRFFLGAGMDPNTKDARGATVLALAARLGHAETVRALATGGALPDLKNSRGWTALHFAASFGRVETVQALLEGKADPQPENEFGVTPMHMAAQGRAVEIVELLLKAGARPDLVAQTGVSPLSIAIETRQADLIKVFERAGHGARMKALKAKFAADLKALGREEAERERDRKAKLRKALEAAGGARDAPPPP